MFIRIIFGLTALVTLAELNPALAQDRRSAKSDAEVAQMMQGVAAITRAAQPVMNNYLTQYNTLVSNSNKTNAVLSSLQKSKSDSQRTNTQDSQTLNAALTNLYGVQTTQLIIPQIVSFDANLVTFVQRYRAEANLSTNPGSTNQIAISGDILHGVRPTMGAMIDAQADDISFIRSIVKSQSDYLTNLGSEFQSLSNGNPASQTQYGFDHYFNGVLLQFEAQKTALSELPIFINGADVTGNPVIIRYPCWDGVGGVAPIKPPFTNDLNTLANTLPASFKDWTTNVFTPIQQWYDGIPNVNPGLLSTWQACSGGKQNSVNATQTDIQHALTNGNTDLARQLDDIVQNLNGQINALKAELSYLKHFRSIDGSIQSEGGIQDNSYNKAYGNAPWRSAITAQTSDLLLLNSFYNDFVVASLALLNKAEDEVITLTKETDPQKLNAAFLQTQKKLTGITDHGFARILQELDSVTTNLKVMAANIRSGGGILEDHIRVYEQVTTLKANSVVNEMNQTLPASLQQAQAAVTSAQNNFNNSFGYVQGLDVSLGSFQSLKVRLQADITSLQPVVAVTSYNPVYTEIVNKMLATVNSRSDYRRVAGKFSKVVKNYLSSFSTVKNDSSGIKVCSGASCRGMTPLSALLINKGKAIGARINTYIEAASLKYLNPKTVASEFQDAQSALNAINALSTTPVS